MGARKYLKVIWLYAVGLVLVFSGLYMIAFSSAGPLGFELMIGGFFLCMIGGVYGKKKLMEVDMAVEPVAAVSRQVEQIKQNVVSQLRPMEPAAVQPQEAVQPQAQPQVQAVQPAPLVQQPQAMEPEQEQPQLRGGIIKVMVCPDCNTENSPQNMYCSNCGKKLRSAPTLKKPAATPQRKKAAKKKKAKAQPQEQQ